MAIRIVFLVFLAILGTKAKLQAQDSLRQKINLIQCGYGIAIPDEFGPFGSSYTGGHVYTPLQFRLGVLPYIGLITRYREYDFGIQEATLRSTLRADGAYEVLIPKKNLTLSDFQIGLSANYQWKSILIVADYGMGRSNFETPSFIQRYSSTLEEPAHLPPYSSQLTREVQTGPFNLVAFSYSFTLSLQTQMNEHIYVGLLFQEDAFHLERNRLSKSFLNKEFYNRSWGLTMAYKLN